MTDTLRTHSWEYFHLHANQRMSVFNFYLVFVGLLSAGLAKVFEEDFPFPELGMVFGFLLFLMSVVFWRLDNRTNSLIKRAEEALRQWESSIPDGDLSGLERVRIFSREQEETERQKGTSWGLLTYGQCLRAVFLVFSIVGIAALVASYYIAL